MALGTPTLILVHTLAAAAVVLVLRRELTGPRAPAAFHDPVEIVARSGA